MHRAFALYSTDNYEHNLRIQLDAQDSDEELTDVFTYRCQLASTIETEDHNTPPHSPIKPITTNRQPRSRHRPRLDKDGKPTAITKSGQPSSPTQRRSGGRSATSPPSSSTTSAPSNDSENAKPRTKPTATIAEATIETDSGRVYRRVASSSPTTPSGWAAVGAAIFDPSRLQRHDHNTRETRTLRSSGSVQDLDLPATPIEYKQRKKK